MTHITDVRSIDNHSAMGAGRSEAAGVPESDRAPRVTLLGIVGAGKRRRAAGYDQERALARWVSEGGA